MNNLPVVFQRIEGLAIFALALGLYFVSGGQLLWLAILFFSFDLSFVGYLAGNKVGAIIYNLVHSMIGPALLAILGITTSHRLVLFALIWLGHIGLDRAFGYGLKFTDGFSHTHLGKIGRDR